MAGVLALVLAFVYVTLQTKRIYQGPVMMAQSLSPSESYAYSAVWLAFALGLFIAGIRLGRQFVRLAGSPSWRLSCSRSSLSTCRTSKACSALPASWDLAFAGRHRLALPALCPATGRNAVVKLSTAVSDIDGRLSPRFFLIGLILAYAAIWIWAAWDPVYRFDWFLETC